MPFLGVQRAAGPPKRSNGRRTNPLPQAIVVGELGSPGIQLDLGRAKTSLGGRRRECDILLIMTRKQAVLLYFAVGEDVR